MSREEAKQMLLGLAGAIVLLASIVAALIVVHRFANSELLIGILGIIGTVAVASMQYRWGKVKEIQARLFADKRDVYTDLVSTIMSSFQNEKLRDKEMVPDELARRLAEVRTKLLIWGSAKSVIALDELSSFADQSQPDVQMAFQIIGSH